MDSHRKEEQRRFPEACRFEKIVLERKICVFFGCVEELGGDNRLEMRANIFVSSRVTFSRPGKLGLERVDLLLAVEYFAVASIYLPGKSEVSR